MLKSYVTFACTREVLELGSCAAKHDTKCGRRLFDICSLSRVGRSLGVYVSSRLWSLCVCVLEALGLYYDYSGCVGHIRLWISVSLVSVSVS